MEIKTQASHRYEELKREVPTKNFYGDVALLEQWLILTSQSHCRKSVLLLDLFPQVAICRAYTIIIIIQSVERSLVCRTLVRVRDGMEFFVPVFSD